MTLARTVHLPTGLAMTFACRPLRMPEPADPATQAQRRAVIELFPQEREWDEAPSSVELTGR